jgi:hypothetical protein
VDSSCAYGNEPSGPIKDRQWLGHLNYYQLFKVDSAPRSCKFIIKTAPIIRKIMNDEVVRMWKETRMALLQDQSPAKTNEKSQLGHQVFRPIR